MDYSNGNGSQGNKTRVKRGRAESNSWSDFETDPDHEVKPPTSKKFRQDDVVVRSVRYPDKYENHIFAAGNNEIHFNAHVDGETITRLKKLISIIVEENKDKLVRFNEDRTVPAERAKDPPVMITYIVNSPGGSVHDVLDCVDYVNFLRCTFANIKFTSIITGMVASAGTIMCVIADKRKMTRFSFAMIHELSTGVARTNYTRIMTHAEFIQNVHNVLVTIYQECRGISMDDVEKKNELEILLKDETWMSPAKYKEHGFVDEIIAVHKRS
ncbi:ATP-dependent Clp protease proteolytic subunit [Yasminevirus sp. GU-2018]|uniref:ATP-dependent Clp protease proteolytic subunit n=1 Tax=Yasminevirus sp. GU-2018 TaxID=2420051 RepID=A0A5K0UBM9_9VIRU|nr:ATP-dependent Clp protease proteolytic subunit [Yasminevirus sp. GU-2018]